ncbi:unnamed protein product [Echinostoma caproni]|uniref:SERTA domain-containing protein n=1 Tax=Echinostoma caproni TaxID=27848 RepID=A0A183ANV0_9TREM|nr:unnamed protein product [Echinostoma caproni]
MITVLFSCSQYWLITSLLRKCLLTSIQVKRQGRQMRRKIHMQLMDMIKTSNPSRNSSSSSVPMRSLDLALFPTGDQNASPQPKHEIVQNIERFLELDCYPTKFSSGGDNDLSETSYQSSDWCDRLPAVAEDLGYQPKLFPTECILDDVPSHAGDEIRLSLNLALFNYYQLSSKAGEVLPRTASEEARLEMLLENEDEVNDNPFGFQTLCAALWCAEREVKCMGKESEQVCLYMCEPIYQ